MAQNYHILNGDCLKEQFPRELKGELIVMRECLIDGSTKGDDLEDFFKVRATFIANSYKTCAIEDYYAITVSEFEKIKSIPKQATVHLWFEDDLFCQVNFWFVSYLLFSFVPDCNLFLVRPKVHTQFGFGGLTKLELVQIFKECSRIYNLEKMANLWKAYAKNDTKKLIHIAEELYESFPFILKAVEAHIARIPTANHPGRPTQTLKKIMKELQTEEFEVVFKEFNRRENIYGFGDVQVKRIFNTILNKY